MLLDAKDLGAILAKNSVVFILALTKIFLPYRKYRFCIPTSYRHGVPVVVVM